LLHITPLCHLPICKLGDVQNLKKGKEVVYTPSAPCRSSRTLLFVRLLLTNSAANFRVSKILIRMHALEAFTSVCCDTGLVAWALRFVNAFDSEDKSG
jgi:hypothetical protein